MRRPLKPNARFRVFERDGFSCRYCGQHAPNVILHVDHVHPVSQGGTDHIDNLVTACSACNAGKAGDQIDPVAQLIAEQRADALCFWALEAVLRHSGREFIEDGSALSRLEDFIAGSLDPLALVKIAREATSWKETLRLWYKAEGYPEYMWLRPEDWGDE